MLKTGNSDAFFREKRLTKNTVISGTVSTTSGFVSSTGLVNTSIYYKGTPISDEELTCKEIIDHLHTDNPAWGARQMSAQLKARG